MLTLTVDTNKYTNNPRLSAAARGYTIGEINGAIASAGRKLGMLLDTKTKRAIRIKLANEGLNISIDSYKKLTDAELLGLRDAISDGAGQAMLAAWIEQQGYEGTPIPQQVDEHDQEMMDWDRDDY